MPEFYTVAEAAELLKTNERTLVDYISQGRIKAISLTGATTARRGKRELRISTDALKDFIKENEVVPNKRAD